MKGLKGKKVGIAAERSADAIHTLIEKQGGIPVIYSIQGRQLLDEQTSLQNVKDFLDNDFDLAVLTTGIGVRTLDESAVNAGLHDAFVDKLQQTKLAVRGSKTLKWLKENNIQPEIVSDDGTMDHLFTLLKEHSPKSSSSRVFLQAYNEDDAKIKGGLEAAGYSVYLSQPYSYEEPVASVLENMKKDIKNHQLDAVVFTSKTQVRNLFSDESDNKELIQAFNGPVLAVAVGKVTGSALKDAGIKMVLQPESQKMGAMVIKIDRYFQEELSS